MIPGNFEYQAPKTLSEAISIIAGNEEAKIIAGGHSLLPMMKLRFAEPTHLVDLKHIEELRGISLEGDHLVIGAMTSESAVLASELVQKHCPLLTDAVSQIADPQVRNKGTIGGDIAHGDPGNDHPAIMLALDAEFVINGPNSKRRQAANGFFLGTYWTGLEQGDILSQVIVPVFTAGMGYGFHKLKRKTGDYATAAAPVVVKMAAGVIKEIRIALTNLGPCAFRAEAAEQLLAGKALNDELLNQACDLVRSACEPAEDLRGDSEYKSHMAAEMARRSILDAVQMAGGN